MNLDLHAFSFPNAITFGAGAISKVPETIKAWGYTRPLVVTDSGVGQLDFYQALLSALQDAGLQASSFTGVEPNPTEANVIAAAAQYQRDNCDVIITIGGGSPMDAAKAIAVAVSGDAPLFDYCKDNGPAIPAQLPDILAIPTTAGTGSEVGRAAVISETDTGIKHILFAPQLLPRAVCADPELTLGLPAKITAMTGMDALTHNVEAYLAKWHQPICEGIALEGVRHVHNALQSAVQDGSNLQAREDMLMASMMGAIAFQKGLGVCHALAHPLTTVANVPHGLANAICLPAALRFNAEVVGDRLATLARHLRLADESAEGFITWVCELQSALPLPTRLSEVGVEDAMLDHLVPLAMQDVCALDNPRSTSAEQYRELYLSVW